MRFLPSDFGPAWDLQLWSGPVGRAGLLGHLDGDEDALQVPREVKGPLVEGGHGQHCLPPHG